MAGRDLAALLTDAPTHRLISLDVWIAFDLALYKQAPALASPALSARRVVYFYDGYLARRNKHAVI